MNHFANDSVTNHAFNLASVTFTGTYSSLNGMTFLDDKANSGHMGVIAECIQYVRDDKTNSIYSLTNALKAYGVEVSGTAHNAQDDAYTLLLLYQAFLSKREITLNHYMKTLARTAHMPEPVAETVRRLSKGETISPEAFRHIVEESLK